MAYEAVSKGIGAGIKDSGEPLRLQFATSHLKSQIVISSERLLGYPRMKSKLAIIQLGRIEKRILILRSQRVMLSTDLAKLYGVAPRVFVQAVKRNIERFPGDFMFQLTKQGLNNLKSQFVTSSWGGIRRAMPYAFTEQDVAMLSSVLRSKRAMMVNIGIMRAFIKLREMLASHRDMARNLAEMEKRYDAQFKVVFDAIRMLMEPARKPRRRIGFHRA